MAQEHTHEHAHGHNHEGCAHQSTDLGQKNRNHFDDVAATVFDTPWIAKVCSQVQEELNREIDWIGYKKPSPESPTKMLDYACGNGVVARALAPYYTNVVGMDISEGMVKQFNIQAEKAGYSEEKMHGIRGDLLNGSADVGEDVSGFDLIVMSMALHHVEDCEKMIQNLSDRLGQGGVLLIIDGVASSESGCRPPKPPADHPARHTVSRSGFEERELRGWLEGVGLKDFKWKWFSERSFMPEELGGENQLFLARAVKG